MKPILVRTSTIPSSLLTFCNGFLKDLSSDYEVFAISSPDKDLDEIALSEGVKTISVSMQRNISIHKDIKSLYQLITIFQRIHPTIVHSMTPKAGLLCMLASWIVRVPIRIHTFTGLVFPTSKGVLKLALMFTDWLTCACATHIIPEGEGVKNDLLKYKITRKPLKVLGNGNIRGIDMNYYMRSESIMKIASNIVKENVFTFIFVGRIVQDKGINELIEATKRLYENDYHFRLLLVGTFYDKLNAVSKKTRDIIDECDYIECVGKKEDVRPWYAASNALVFPSYREGFPNVVLEAGAMELPSIVTNINGSREIINNNINGIIVPPKNSDALYHAMKYFLDNPDQVQLMASNARKIVSEKFEQSFVRNCQKNFYKEVLLEKNL